MNTVQINKRIKYPGAAAKQVWSECCIRTFVPRGSTCGGRCLHSSSKFDGLTEANLPVKSILWVNPFDKFILVLGLSPFQACNSNAHFLSTPNFSDIEGYCRSMGVRTPSIAIAINIGFKILTGRKITKMTLVFQLSKHWDSHTPSLSTEASTLVITSPIPVCVYSAFFFWKATQN